MKDTKETNIITIPSGGKVEVNTQGKLWGFMAWDITTNENPDYLWFGEKIKIEGIKDEKLYGTVEGEDGEKNLVVIYVPNDLILLKRPGLEIKVGDEVVALNFTPKGEIGEVIVIDPYCEDVLIEFKDWRKGHDGSTVGHLGKPYYPERYKTASKSRYWLKAEDLELLKSA